jgi:hypothetical protein
MLLENPCECDRRWSEEVSALAEKMSDLKGVVASHTRGEPALTDAMSSPEDVAAGQRLVRLARKKATLLFAEHLEDVPHPKQA